MRRLAAILAAALCLSGPLPRAVAETPVVPEAVAAQSEAMRGLRRFAGTWRGPAWVVTPQGTKVHFTQTERVGPMQEGTVMVFEGRAYGEGDRLLFNALAMVAFDAGTGAHTMAAHAMGRLGLFAFTPTDDGFTWEAPAGKGDRVRYTARVAGDRWHQVGDHLGPGGSRRVFEMDLRRVGSTAWPAQGAVGPR